MLVGPATVRALCDGYDEAQRLRDEAAALRDAASIDRGGQEPDWSDTFGTPDPPDYLTTTSEQTAFGLGYHAAQAARRQAVAAVRAGLVVTADERDAARQALTDLIGELRGLCDDPKQPGDAVWTDDLRAVIDPYDPDLFQCVHCEQYRDVNDGTDSVAGMACHDCASKP
jgi:hypothetical protein